MNINRREFLGRSLKIGLALATGLVVPNFIKISKANSIENRIGALHILNWIESLSDCWPIDIVHRPGATEDYGAYDSPYNAFNHPNSKIVSVVQTLDGHKELDYDARPLDSFMPIDLELSVHTNGDPISPASQNELWCALPLAGPPNFYDFGVKPITLWRRFPAEPDKLQFLADIREAIDKSNFEYYGIKYARVPLPFMDKTYESQVPYERLQARFDVHPGNLNFSLDQDGKVIVGIVDMKDLAILREDWGKKGAPLEFLADITGEQGLPDGNVDAMDLELLTRYWLKDIRDIMP